MCLNTDGKAGAHSYAFFVYYSGSNSIYLTCFFSLLFWTAFIYLYLKEANNGSYILLGIQLLMEMLFEKSSSGNTAEVAACERVQQKSAVTLARLSRDPEVADAAVKLSCKDVSLA